MNDAAICPYCFSPVDGEAIVCPGCGTTHHTDCWETAEGCAVVGCRQAGGGSNEPLEAPPPLSAPAPVTPPPFTPAQVTPPPIAPPPLAPRLTMPPVARRQDVAQGAGTPPDQPPRAYERLFRRSGPPEVFSVQDAEVRHAPRPARGEARNGRGRLVLLIAVLAIAVSAAVAGWTFRDQLLGSDIDTASAAQPSAQASEAPSRGAVPASAADLEADIQEKVGALGEEPPRSVDCFGAGDVVPGELVDCTVQMATASVEVTVRVTDTDPIAYASRWDPADFSAAEPTQSEQRSIARTGLNRLRDNDVDSLLLDGRWAVQLSSKAEGITDPLQMAENGTHTFHAPDILAEHESFRYDGGIEEDVLLVKGTDFGEVSTYNGKPFWITLVVGDFDSSDDVERWCETEFPHLPDEQLENSCLPRTLDPPY